MLRQLCLHDSVVPPSLLLRVPLHRLLLAIPMLCWRSPLCITITIVVISSLGRSLDGFGRMRASSCAFGPVAMSLAHKLRVMPHVSPLSGREDTATSSLCGQTTAAVTGAIAVILGVAYLVLVQLLDSPDCGDIAGVHKEARVFC
ncbi:hypothetical protein GOP47_0027094 [Adiantum capillus-veneris]|nr:hypothetical protein GOP47_0027094 [Adiantum capillus-veneris]